MIRANNFHVRLIVYFYLTLCAFYGHEFTKHIYFHKITSISSKLKFQFLRQLCVLSISRHDLLFGCLG